MWIYDSDVTVANAIKMMNIQNGSLGVDTDIPGNFLRHFHKHGKHPSQTIAEPEIGTSIDSRRLGSSIFGEPVSKYRTLLYAPSDNANMSRVTHHNELVRCLLLDRGALYLYNLDKI